MNATKTEADRQTNHRAEEASPLKPLLDKPVGHVQSIRNTAAQFLGVPPERVCDILRNVWTVSQGQPPLTDAEMFLGMSMIARFGLDPVGKEVYVTRTKRGLCCIIGIDGWIKILDRTEGYDGFEQDEEFDEAGNLVCIETRIYSTKRSRPAKYRAYMREYSKVSGNVAGLIPMHMLGIFSLHHAARRFTPVGGSLVSQEEARWMDAYAETPEDNRTRQNVLKDKVKQAASEFEPIPQTMDPPFNPPTEAEQAAARETEPLNEANAPAAPADHETQGVAGSTETPAPAVDYSDALAYAKEKIDEMSRRASANAAATGIAKVVQECEEMGTLPPPALEEIKAYALGKKAGVGGKKKGDLLS
jgi:hypothetical protein